MDRLTTVQWLDLVKQELNLKSDNELAINLGVTRQTISGYRKGKASMNAKVATTIAARLEIWPMLTIASTMYEQATKEEDRLFWQGQFDLWNEKEKRRPGIHKHLPDRRTTEPTAK